MPTPRTRFINPYLNRYLEQAVENIGIEHKRYLTAEDRLHLVKLRSFLLNGSLEEKLLLLAKLGHSFAIVVGDQKKKQTVQELWRLFKVFFKKVFFDKKKAVTELREAGIFAIMDVDVVKSMMMASNLYNSPMYNLLNSYQAIGDKIFAYQQDARKLQKELLAAEEIDMIIIKGMRVAIMKRSAEEFKKLNRINYYEYMLLSFLSKNRQAKIADLKDYVDSRASAVLLRLQEKGMVNMRYATDPAADGRIQYSEYWISGFGETVLQEARKYFIQHLL